MTSVSFEHLVAQVRREVDRFNSTLAPDQRLALIYPIFAGNFLVRKQGLYPLVDLSVVPDEDLFAKFTYQYHRTETSVTKEWGGVIRFEAESADTAPLSCGDRKFERELSRFLLQPLLDANFSAPDTN